MGTLVSIDADATDAQFERAFGWFREIEARCSRFMESSELRQLKPGHATPASPVLFEAVRFAKLVAEESGGAFDPTLGSRMSARGYNREHRTHVLVVTPLAAADASYRDIELDEDAHTILLRRPLTLDLGAVAKGLAVDTAARELEPCKDFAIDAGGDIYLAGTNSQGEPWTAGIPHPHNEDQMIARLRIENQAVCTSGAAERGEHILDPRSGEPVRGVVSATVVAPGAMLADALATAAYVLGPAEGIAFLERMGVEGLIVDAELGCHETANLPHA